MNADTVEVIWRCRTPGCHNISNHIGVTIMPCFNCKKDDWEMLKVVAAEPLSPGDRWLEPWCEDHPDGDGQHCYACLGASHDGWMHRAKTAETVLRDIAQLTEPGGTRPSTAAIHAMAENVLAEKEGN